MSTLKKYIALFIVLCLFSPLTWGARLGKEVRVGFLAHLGVEKAHKMWEPTLEYLAKKIPDYHFTLVPLTNDDIQRVVEKGQIDFLLTNPASYVIVEAKYGLSRIATLRKRDKQTAYTLFGSVIFTRADRNDINSLRDLVGKSYMGIHRNGFGGWWMAWREFRNQGIDPYRDFSKLSFSGFPQAKVAHAVLNGEVDAGNVRTGVLERMAREGVIDMDQIKILNPQRSIFFPANHSTQLYPEWPFGVLHNVPYDLTQKVALALFSMESEHPAAKAAGIAGWTIPLDYKPVHDLMKELEVGHYQNYGGLQVSDVFEKYWRSISMIIAAMATLVTLVVVSFQYNKRLAKANQALQKEIFEREKLQEKLRYQALHDGLTELPNRVFFTESINKTLVDCREKKHHFAVAIIDLDQFKEVNDTLGHQTGDLLLQQVAKRLYSSIRECDIIARLGGDEFAVIMDTKKQEESLRLGKEILGHLDEPVHVDGRQFLVGASMGVAHYPTHGKEADVLLRHADIAMYEAKRCGTNIILYEASLGNDSEARLTLQSDVREAVSNEEAFEVFYQPRVQCETSEISCLEAVVRWRHPQRGMVSPNDFIPVVEDLGLMERLTLTVLEQVLKDSEQWQADGLDFSVSINMGVSALIVPGFAKKLSTVLEASPIARNRLEIEISKSLRHRFLDNLIDVVNEFIEQGLTFSVDNFGEDHLSLSHLSRIPISGIKIDRTYMRDLTKSEVNKEIVTATIAMARKMGLWVTAAGVEDEESWMLLKKLGADYAQGYYFSEPLPYEAMNNFLKQTDWGVRSINMIDNGQKTLSRR